jgi:type IV pilus assembly protein PilB
MTYTRERLGEILVEEGVIDEDILRRALEKQRELGGKLGQILVSEEALSEDELAETLAQQKGLEHVSLYGRVIDREATALVPVRFARMQQVVPVGFDGKRLILAMADPLDIEAMDEVRLMTGLEIEPVVAAASEISEAIERYMVSSDAFTEIREITEDETPAAERVDESIILDEEDVPVVRLVYQIVREAVLDRASDIHIEPQEDDVRIRYRVDGVLKQVTTLPSKVRAGVTSRVKIMADLDIAERRLPQDGRATVAVDEKRIDLRVATLPTQYGETITIRLLRQDVSLRTLEDLGMAPDDLEKIRVLLQKPYGALLAAGPTGSGKTTTLYAAINRLNDPSRKIITVEDPIEYRLPGVTQIAVRPKIGLTFAAGLRTILRADPDVVMVGEMRDPETAEIGIRSALTGHIVFSTIHTNDAPSALTRLIDMDVPPFITSSALLGVVAQRLARRLCDECKRETAYERGFLTGAGYSEDEAGEVTLFQPEGCPKCGGTGFRGRVGLFEVMVMDEALGRLFMQEAASEELRRTAIENGMHTLRMDGLAKAAEGVTSIEEVLRVSA